MTLPPSGVEIAQRDRVGRHPRLREEPVCVSSHQRDFDPCRRPFRREAFDPNIFAKPQFEIALQYEGTSNADRPITSAEPRNAYAQKTVQTLALPPGIGDQAAGDPGGEHG